DAARLARLALAEIARLERLLSLYRADSALVRLNASGRLDAPPPEMLEILSLCNAIHRASGGRFDPTVQPLWATLARAHSAGHPADPARIAEARALVGWQRVSVTPASITLGPGMALTLNGVAQGYVADRVAALLRAEGLALGLIDTGEIAAIGAGWPVRIEDGPRLSLGDEALATSGLFGTVMDRDGRQGHILSPDGRDRPAPWARVSIAAPRAAVADALSTAACLMPDTAHLNRLVARFPGARLAHLAVRP
ncbi:MAG: FAD:protein FMN transferase, partial [Rhodobacteraceae bacterium]|nr:FAD:protein FMN transferase [Paracoccaceae bacterium]